MKKYIKIIKVNKIFNCGINKSYNLVKKYKSINKIRKFFKKKKNKTLNTKRFYNIYYKINKNKNYLVINKFYFESDLFKDKKSIKKKCIKINNMVFKNLYFKINNKKKINRYIKYLSIKINEKIYFRTKILRYKNIFLYLHLNKSLCVLKLYKKSNFKEIILNIFFYKIRDIYLLSKKYNVINNKQKKIGDIKNYIYLKKIYFF
ncbi:hypothetical protein ACT2CC_00545 [Candidatus Vidania fulgoroideorum]